MPEPRVNYDEIAPTYDSRYKSGIGEGQHTIPSALRELLPPGQTNRILEVGCGTGYWLRSFGGGNKVFGIDLSPGMLGQARKRQPDAMLVCGDAGHLPFPDESFELAYCVNAFHHFQDKPGFIAGARRILRRDGVFAIIGMDPHGQSDKWYIYDYFERTREMDLRRFPSISTIEQWMIDRGFEGIASRRVERILNPQYERSVLEHSVLQKNGTSQLALLTDAEYAAGLTRLRADLAAAEAKGAVPVFPEDISLMMITGHR
jgi:ubiquinone/menaquinone biosynthesis C-methylase UbiE